MGLCDLARVEAKSAHISPSCTFMGQVRLGTKHTPSFCQHLRRPRSLPGHGSLLSRNFRPCSFPGHAANSIFFLTAQLWRRTLPEIPFFTFCPRNLCPDSQPAVQGKKAPSKVFDSLPRRQSLVLITPEGIHF